MKKLLPIISLIVFITLSGCESRPLKITDPAFIRQFSNYDYCGIRYTKQQKSYSCGTACLSTVINYWGIYATETKLMAEFTPSPKFGYSLNDLHNIASSYGLQAYILDMGINSKSRLYEQVGKGRPVICAVEYPKGLYAFYGLPVFGQIYRGLVLSLGRKTGHYVVVFGYKEGKVLLMDPAYGFQAQSWRKFQKCWARKRYAVLLCVKEDSR